MHFSKKKGHSKLVQFLSFITVMKTLTVQWVAYEFALQQLDGLQSFRSNEIS